jgi:hypothetical protein
MRTKVDEKEEEEEEEDLDSFLFALLFYDRHILGRSRCKFPKNTRAKNQSNLCYASSTAELFYLIATTTTQTQSLCIAINLHSCTTAS